MHATKLISRSSHCLLKRQWVCASRRSLTTSRSPPSLQHIDTIVFDCDGVVWRGDQLIPGTAEAIEKLRCLKKNIFFVTNNSTRSREGTRAKFTGLGIPVTADEILTSSFAAAVYLKKIGFAEREKKHKAYVIGDHGIVEELAGVGIPSLGGPHHANKEVDFSSHFVTDPDIGVVVVGLDVSINYYKLQYAQICLNATPLPGQDPCLLVGTNADASFPNRTQLWPGAGSIVASIVGCTGRVPVIVGKPSAVLIDHLVGKCGCSVDRMMMVGDRLDTDILFGREHGMATCLTLSGVTTPAILEAEDNHIHPDFIVNSIAGLPSLFVNTQL